MARKSVPYAIYETQEQFDQHCERLIESGREMGFNEGRIWVLSYINELLEDLFSGNDFKLAEMEKAARNIELWRRDKECMTLKQKLEWKQLKKQVEDRAIQES